VTYAFSAVVFSPAFIQNIRSGGMSVAKFGCDNR
jgi:hypothetical protein